MKIFVLNLGKFNEPVLIWNGGRMLYQQIFLEIFIKSFT